MKFFFLAFIALLAFTGNAAIFDVLSLGRLIGGISFNLFILSLVAIWWASYFSGTEAKARLLVAAHAGIMLAAGIGMAIIGAHVAVSNSCESLIFVKPRVIMNAFFEQLGMRSTPLLERLCG